MFDWGDYLDQANRLAAGGDEAGQRSAISRAYYAAFGLARRRLETVEGNPVPPTGRAHQYVWNAFVSNPPEARRAAIAASGTRLRRRRNLADYDDAVPDLGTLTRETLMEAQRVIDTLGAL